VILFREFLVPGAEVERHPGVPFVRGPLVEAAARERFHRSFEEFVREPPAADVARDPGARSDFEDVADGRADEVGEQRTRR
jgi:hypothetical protein